MKWNRFTVKTKTEAEDIVISTLAEVGIEGVEIQDKQPLTEEDKAQMFVDIMPEGPADDGVAYLNFYLEEDAVEEVFQSHKHLNEATQGFREQVFCENIIYTYNPLLNYAMSNAVIRQSNGLIKIDKDATTKRIDPVDATLCAFKLAMFHTFGDDYGDYIDNFIEEILHEDSTEN